MEKYGENILLQRRNILIKTDKKKKIKLVVENLIISKHISSIELSNFEKI